MKTMTNRLSKRGVMTLLTATAALAAGLFAFPSTALADNDRGLRGRESSRRVEQKHDDRRKRDIDRRDHRRHDARRHDARRDDHRRHDVRRHDVRRHDDRRHDYRSHDRYDRVPRRFHQEHRSHYRPYYHGRAYYRPHRHYHSLYRFPVFVGGHIVYRSYPYCGDDLYLSGSFVAPRLAIGFGFGGPLAPPPPYGLWIGGYYSR